MWALFEIGAELYRIEFLFDARTSSHYLKFQAHCSFENTPMPKLGRIVVLLSFHNSIPAGLQFTLSHPSAYGFKRLAFVYLLLRTKYLFINIAI